MDPLKVLAEGSLASLGKVVSLWLLKQRESEIRCQKRPREGAKSIKKGVKMRNGGGCPQVKLQVNTGTEWEDRSKDCKEERGFGTLFITGAGRLKAPCYLFSYF